MKKDNIPTGKLGEKIAIKELTKRGYKICDRNYRTRFGEIDLVAQDGDVWVLMFL